MMPEAWFELDDATRREAIEQAAAQTGQAVHILEKDVWVVWALSVLYGSTFAEDLTFKGGTSLSKVYKLIDRFSEDIDLTYDISRLVPDLADHGFSQEMIPETRSSANRIRKEVSDRLPQWIASEIVPLIESAVARDATGATVAAEKDLVTITYPALTPGNGYVAPTIRLEFGARSTGRPNGPHPITCTAAAVIGEIVFPTAAPLVMAAERTFWEKATLAHLYALNGKMSGNRYSRHWYDLAAFGSSSFLPGATNDQGLAEQVARHKARFFRANDSTGQEVDYLQAVRGQIRLIPAGDALERLEADYLAMDEDALFFAKPPSFTEVIEACGAIERTINRE
jgi:hypothetical protein